MRKSHCDINTKPKERQGIDYKCVLVAQSCLILGSSGSSVRGILQAKILEWVAFPSPGDLPDSQIEHWSLALQTDSLPCETPGKPIDYKRTL